jgi:uncharacterized protein (DUF1778 family)
VAGLDGDHGAALATRPRGRDRTHQGSGRRNRVNARFSDAELGEVETAAAAVGMTPTGFLAEAALAAARDAPAASLDPMRETLARLEVELFDARVAVGRIGTNLNQAVAALNATGQAPAWLERVAWLCEQRMLRVDAVISRIDHALP